MMKTRKISLFYKVLLGLILALLAAFCYIRFGLLRPWLVRFEAAQPKHASQEVFADLFSPADWGRVYDLAGLDAGVYGDREGFARSMEELTSGREMTLVETSAGLSGARRYIVKAGGDSVAAFTLTNRGTEDGEADWQMEKVELLLGQTGTVSVRAPEGWSVLVNGAELEEDCVAQTVETAAERYLPEGIHGRRTVLWQTRTSAIRQAEVNVLDREGRSAPLSYENGCFTAEEPDEEPDEEARAALLGAARTYARFMIREASSEQLRRYFDSGSRIYETIRSSEIWIKNTAGHSFDGEEISEYRRYGGELFSARVRMDMNVQRANGTLKGYHIDSTFFFRRTAAGWRAFEMTNVDVQREITHTRLIFMDGQKELGRLFVSSEERAFTPPEAPAPAGRRFAGWAVREKSGDSVTMTVRFRPGADGTVTLPAGWIPEPMTLYAVFE